LEEEHLIKRIEDTRKLLHNTTKIIINDGTVRKEFTEEESKRIRENIDKLKSQISKILEESKKAGRNKEILSALSELSTSIDMSVDFVPRGKEIEGTPLEMFLELDDCRRLIEDFVQQSYVKKEDMELDIKKVLESGTKGEKIELLRKISGMKLAEEDISTLLKVYDQEKDPEISKMLKGVISLGLKKNTFDYATLMISSISPKVRLEAVKYIDALELNNIIEIRNVLFDAYLKEEDTIVRNMLIDVITRRFGPELFLEYTNRIKKEEDFEKLAALLPATHDMIVKIWDKVGNNHLSENNTKFMESLLNRANAAKAKGAEDLNLQDIYVLSKKDEEYESKIVTNLAPYGAKVYKLLEKGSTLGEISKGAKIGITNATRIIQDLMLADIVVIRKNEVTQANQEEIISSREGEEIFNVLFNPVNDAAETVDSQEKIAEMRCRNTDKIPVMKILKDTEKNLQELAWADEKESKPVAENISQEISSINNKTEENIEKEMPGDLNRTEAPEDSVVQEIAQGILREVFSEGRSDEINESANERSLVTNETNRSVREILLKIAEEVAGEENRADQKSEEKLEIEVKTESPESEKKEIPEQKIEEKPETEGKTEMEKSEIPAQEIEEKIETERKTEIPEVEIKESHEQRIEEKPETEGKTEMEKSEIPAQEIEEKIETERKTEIPEVQIHKQKIEESPKVEEEEIPEQKIEKKLETEIPEVEKKETGKEEGLEVEKKEVQRPEPKNGFKQEKEELLITEKKKESKRPEPENKLNIVYIPTKQEKEELLITEKKKESKRPEPENKLNIVYIPTKQEKEETPITEKKKESKRPEPENKLNIVYIPTKQEKEETPITEKKKESKRPEPENKLNIVYIPTKQEKEELLITEKKKESKRPEPEKKVIIDESAYNTSAKRGNESKSKPVGRGPPPAPKEEEEKGEEKKAKNEMPKTEEDIKIAEELSWVLSRCFQYGKVTDERVFRLTNEILKEIAKDKRVEVTDIIDIAVRAQIPFVSQRNIEKNAYELEQALLNAYYKFPRKSKKENVGKRVLKWLAIAALIAGISAGVWRYGGEIPKKEIYTYTKNVYKESNKIAKDALKLIERKANDIENRAKNARKKAEDIVGKVKKMKQ